MTVFLLSMMLPCFIKAQTADSITIGTGTSYTGLPIDSYNLDMGQKSQVIYPAWQLDELRGRPITGVQYFAVSGGGTNWTSSYTVSLGTIEEDRFNSDELFDDSGFQVVFEGVVNVENGMFRFDFDQEYVYPGGNLVIEIAATAGVWQNNYYFEGDWATNRSCVAVHDNTSDTWMNTVYNYYPKTEFFFTTTCLQPMMDTIIFGHNEATVVWSGEAEQYAIEIGYDTIIVSGHSYMFTGLEEGDHRQYRIRAICGDGDSGRWVTNDFYYYYDRYTAGNIGNSYQSTFVPIYGARATDSVYHSQMIYHAGDIEEVADQFIWGLEFYVNEYSTVNTIYEIRLGTVEQEEFTSANPIDNSNFTLVYTGQLEYWGSLQALFTTPFDYRGGNLIVDITTKTPGDVNQPLSFQGRRLEGASMMRCSGIAGRYPFQPRVDFIHSPAPVPQRDSVHTVRDSVCMSNDIRYEWTVALEREDHTMFDSTICRLDLRAFHFDNDDTTVLVTKTMPRNLKGCANEEQLEITLFQPKKHIIDDTVCQANEAYTEYGLNFDLTGVKPSTTMLLTDQSQWGDLYPIHCFDTTYVRLRVNRTYLFNRNLRLCQSRLSAGEGDTLYYNYSGHRIAFLGPVPDTQMVIRDTLFYTSVTGCDSIIALNITVSRSDRSDTTLIVKESELPYTAMGVVFNYACTRSRVLYNQLGCDSTVRMTLQLMPSYRDTTFFVGCGAYEWRVFDPDLNDSVHVCTATRDTIAKYWLTASDGLDSILYLRYRKGRINRLDTVVTRCNLYRWHDIDVTTTSTLIDTTMGVGYECDTQMVWHIYINHPILRSEVASVCDSIVWYDNVYRESTTAVHTYMANLCENADTLHLTVRYSTIGDTLVYAPQDYQCYGYSWSESGDYIYVIENAVGCDSVVSLKLYLTPHNTPLPQIYVYGNNVLMLNHYPFGDSTRYDYDSVYWLHDGVLMEGFSGDIYHLDNYGPLSGCFQAWTLIEGVWFPSNELCFSNSINGFGDVLTCKVMPNPVAGGDRVRIAADGVTADMLSIEIYDAQGRAVKKLAHSDQFIADLPAGIYMMRILLDDGRSAVRKIVIK